jgi:septum formation inhibitor-activating ATPase MinD
MDIAGMLINKTYGKNFELSIKDVEEMTGIPVLGVLPYEINSLKALSQFRPSTAYNPRSRASKEYKKLAATLIGEKYRPLSLRKIFLFAPKREEVNREVYYESMFK